MKKLMTFAFVALVTILLSILLASTIALPLRKLAAAAERVRRGINKRVEIPDFSARGDEIGDLSVSLRAMTEALSNRLDEIERFAADVAHEIKNPLTPMKLSVQHLRQAYRDKAPDFGEVLERVSSAAAKRVLRLCNRT